MDLILASPVRSSIALGNDRVPSEHTFQFDDIKSTPLYEDGSDASAQLDNSGLTFTAPANHADLPAGTPFLMSGMAIDVDGFKELALFRGATRVADLTVDGSGNWSWSWEDPKVGDYQVHIYAYDNLNYEVRSQTLYVTMKAKMVELAAIFAPHRPLMKTPGSQMAWALWARSTMRMAWSSQSIFTKAGDFLTTASLSGNSF